jgi:hypothetical protein
MKREYRVVKYLTLTGIREFVELGGAYGEWIVYENNKAKYLVHCFDKESESNKRITDLLDKKQETWASILSKIRQNRKINLNMGNYPWIRIEISSRSEVLDLPPIPIKWLNEIESRK